MKKNLLFTMFMATGLISACNNGGSNSITSVASSTQYSTLSTYPNPSSGSSTVVTGIRGVANSSNVYISGIYFESTANSGLLYVGPISTTNGVWNLLNYPSSPNNTVTNTALYGPNSTENGGIVIVGNYSTQQFEGGNGALGLIFTGTVDAQGNINGNAGVWKTIVPQVLEESPVINTIAHSNMGNLVVGNYDTVLDRGKAFIYDINNNQYFGLHKPGSISTTAYGIWWNGGESYTIAGGYSDGNKQGLTTGYLVDWNAETHVASNWTSINYMNQPISSAVAHIEGITTDNNGGYNLAADVTVISQMSLLAAFVHVGRNSDGSFTTPQWTTVNYPNSIINSANTVYENTILGVYSLTNSTSQLNSFSATVQ